ncbi:MAG: hypothetical protein M1816_000131 [Peltula sp. TS41687]|nr:MAG: hypothetical protein M1816_000131 [Peltula sp. TS41687]
MPSSQYFSVPLPARDRVRTLRASHDPSRRNKCRRRANPTEEAEDEDGGLSDGANNGPSTPAPAVDAQPTRTPWSALTTDADTVAQYRVAGYSGLEAPLPSHFPHRGGLDCKTRAMTRNDTANELSKLGPPLFVPAPSLHPKSLALQHLSVLTAVMYRCLLEGEYTRAGRAWGMLLRTEMRGRAIDLRSEGRWGIGAEVLLREARRPSEEVGHDREDDDDDDADSSDNSDVDDADKPKAARDRSRPGSWFTREGFKRAKEYYERLILQYPYDKRWAHKVNSLHFYLAMFGLWIYMTQQEREERTTRITRSSAGDVAWDQEQTGSDSAEEIRERELLEAESIASRMDELMLSPPYLDSPELWHLRGMVALWMADLHLPTVSALPQGDDEDIDPRQRYVRGTDLTRRNDELNRAESAFQKVRATGGAVWEGSGHIMHDVREITEDV